MTAIMTRHHALLALKRLDVQSHLSFKCCRQEADLKRTASLWLRWPGSGHDRRHVTPAPRRNVSDFDLSMTYGTGFYATTIWSRSKPSSGWKLRGASVYWPLATALLRTARSPGFIKKLDKLERSFRAEISCL
jgi:hypothetical protein